MRSTGRYAQCAACIVRKASCAPSGLERNRECKSLTERNLLEILLRYPMYLPNGTITLNHAYPDAYGRISYVKSKDQDPRAARIHVSRSFALQIGCALIEGALTRVSETGG